MYGYHVLAPLFRRGPLPARGQAYLFLLPLFSRSFPAFCRSPLRGTPLAGASFAASTAAFSAAAARLAARASSAATSAAVRRSSAASASAEAGACTDAITASHDSPSSPYPSLSPPLSGSPGSPASSSSPLLPEAPSPSESPSPSSSAPSEASPLPSPSLPLPEAPSSPLRTVGRSMPSSSWSSSPTASAGMKKSPWTGMARRRCFSAATAAASVMAAPASRSFWVGSGPLPTCCDGSSAGSGARVGTSSVWPGGVAKKGIFPRCQSYSTILAAVLRSGSPPLSRRPPWRASCVRKSSVSVHCFSLYARRRYSGLMRCRT
mmetsp:Transcript_19934/g.60246  ORF Transcript_19934/g.60246 Transcript_19934/m.60246 type:complete len:320 (-) Transcript_19934:764-1723(-)